MTNHQNTLDKHCGSSNPHFYMLYVICYMLSSRWGWGWKYRIIFIHIFIPLQCLLWLFWSFSRLLSRCLGLQRRTGCIGMSSNDSYKYTRSVHLSADWIRQCRTNWRKSQNWIYPCWMRLCKIKKITSRQWTPHFLTSYVWPISLTFW